jgi:hypothetical protein
MIIMHCVGQCHSTCLSFINTSSQSAPTDPLSCRVVQPSMRAQALNRLLWPPSSRPPLLRPTHPCLSAWALDAKAPSWPVVKRPWPTRGKRPWPKPQQLLRPRVCGECVAACVDVCCCCLHWCRAAILSRAMYDVRAGAEPPSAPVVALVIVPPCESMMKRVDDTPCLRTASSACLLVRVFQKLQPTHAVDASCVAEVLSLNHRPPLQRPTSPRLSAQALLAASAPCLAVQPRRWVCYSCVPGPWHSPVLAHLH